MKILISNDDGIFSPGIKALVSAFAKAGHEVYVAAPDSQRSAASHSMTLFRPLTAKETAFEGAVKAWAIDGTPVDWREAGGGNALSGGGSGSFRHQPRLQRRFGCSVFGNGRRGDRRRVERQACNGGFSGTRARGVHTTRRRHWRSRFLASCGSSRCRRIQC